MATRFYLPSSGAASISPAFSTWTTTVGADRINMYTTKTNTAITAKARTYGGASGDHALLRQYISPPIAAQTISGTAAGVGAVQESNTLANVFTYWLLRVFSGDGLTLRGSTTGSADGTEWPGTWASRYHSYSLTSVTAQGGDVLVLEVGFRKDSSTSYTMEFEFGDNDPDDHPASDGDTAVKNPWFEMSMDVVFQGTTSNQLMMTGAGT